MTLQPIETTYRGYRFRSRLEARWAVFFQTLGVPWEYEPQGYKLSDGRWYLPDFRIKLADGLLWAEVKPGGVEHDDRFDRFLEDIFPADLSTALPPGLHPAIGVWLHEIPDPADVETGGGHGQDGQDFHVRGDFFYQFCICRKCNAVGFEYEGRSARIHCGCSKDGDRDHTYDHPRILKAYAAARAARFEHGENSIAETEARHD